MIVDWQTHIVGQATTRYVHLLSNIESQQSLIHRAFALVLFDTIASYLTAGFIRKTKHIHCYGHMPVAVIRYIVMLK